MKRATQSGETLVYLCLLFKHLLGSTCIDYFAFDTAIFGLLKNK